MLDEMLKVPSGVGGFSCAREGFEVADADDEDMDGVPESERERERKREGEREGERETTPRSREETTLRPYACLTRRRMTGKRPRPRIETTQPRGCFHA